LKIQLEEAKRTEEVMKIQMMKKEEEVEKLEEEVVTLRSKIVKLNKNIEETETSTSTVENEEKHSRLQKRRMKKRVRVMQKYSKEGIMVNKNQRRMSIIEIHLQQDLPHSGTKKLQP
jgi:predicted  nucleic acid-binding Zn-ribbon protein